MLDSHLIAHTRPEARRENVFLAGDVRVTVLADRLFRVEKGVLCDRATQAVWFRDMPPQAFTAQEADGVVTVETPAVTLTVRKEDLTGTVTMGRKKVPLDNTGNLLGTYRTLDACNGSTYLPYDGSAPYEIALENGVCSRSGVAVMDDSHSLILGSDGALAPRPGPAADLYIFAYGHDYRGAVRALYTICGPTPLIPRFALGNWWSRYYAYTEKQYLDLMDRFQRWDIPLTVATVDMDWHWSTTLDQVKHITESGKNDAFHGGADGWTGYSWNTDLFPNYKSFLKKLHDRDLKVTLNLHPALGVRWFEDMYPQMCAALGRDPESGEQIKFNIADEDFINAYFQILHKPYERDGVDFWWVDWQQGTESAMAGLDPLWSLNHYHTLDIARDRQPLILSRYCGLGSHRYPLGFSGDTHMTWKTLRYLPYFTATASNAGYTWWSHDIGGHQGGRKDDELYVRFLQFGVFSPINRLHCTCSEVFSKEPMVYMNGAGLIAEEFLRLRHRMIPLLYTASVDTHERGRALIEPMYYEYPESPQAYRAPGQYLFAGQLLVAPITEKRDGSGMAGVNVWLPEGRWTDIFTGDEYAGGRRLRLLRWLDTLPVLARQGAVVPLDASLTGNSIDLPQVLEVLVFNGDGAYTLREDRQGRRLDTVFCASGAEGRQKLTVTMGLSRTMRVEFRNIPEGTATVRRRGRAVKCHVGGDACLTVTFEAKAGAEYEIAVEYAPDPRARYLERVKYDLTRFEMDTPAKNSLYEALSQTRPEEVPQIIAQAPLPRRYKERLRESLME